MGIAVRGIGVGTFVNSWQSVRTAYVLTNFSNYVQTSFLFSSFTELLLFENFELQECFEDGHLDVLPAY